MYKKKHKDANKFFKLKHSAGEVILWLVRWYGRIECRVKWYFLALIIFLQQCF